MTQENESRAAALQHEIVAAGERTLDNVTHTAQQLGERARRAGAAGADYARRAGASTAEFVSDNALPLSLIGLGVGWLVLSARKQRLREDQLAGHDGEFGAPSVSRGGSKGSQARAVVADVQHRVGELASRTREASGELASRVGENLDAARSAVADGLDVARSKVADGLDSARAQLTHAGRRSVDYADENPLLIGALAVAAGVGVGLALPATRRENELLGETRDRLLGDARGLIGEAREAAREVQRQARETTQELRTAVKEPRFSH
jgi:ElaB/YqjD/DUF883 family membrane-anchored ribosome-binding protein